MALGSTRFRMSMSIAETIVRLQAHGCAIRTVEVGVPREKSVKIARLVGGLNVR